MDNPQKKEDLLKILQRMIENIDGLPSGAMFTPINHYDYQSLLLLLSALFREAFADRNS